MGRLKNKGKGEERSMGDDYDWPWKLSITLPPLVQPKVCFLSGKEREYFPDDPGYSRHGIEYSMNCHPGDTPNPSYFPSENRLQKPVSLKGYGIGGLSAPRFARNHLLKTPADGAYQAEIIQAILKPEKMEGKNKLGLDAIRPCNPAQRAVFGSSLNVDRFGLDSKWQSVGVGHYELKSVKPCKKLTIQTVFGSGPGKVIPPVFNYCQFEGFDKCVICKFELSVMDYYRSRRPIKVPQPTPTDTEITVSVENMTKTVKNDKKAPPAKYVSICRKCFTEIMAKGHPFWTKRSLLTDFQKTRHCINIHEHRGLPTYEHKAPCNLIRKLTRKEAMMTRFFTEST